MGGSAAWGGERSVGLAGSWGGPPATGPLLGLCPSAPAFNSYIFFLGSLCASLETP